MAYRPHPIGNALYFGDARVAQRELRAAFVRYRTRRAVARALGVNEGTVWRWLQRLAVLGLPLKHREFRSASDKSA